MKRAKGSTLVKVKVISPHQNTLFIARLRPCYDPLFLAWCLLALFVSCLSGSTCLQSEKGGASKRRERRAEPSNLFVARVRY